MPETLHVTLNQQPLTLPAPATLADALAAAQPQPPYAVALNLQFVPKAAYASTPLHMSDAIEVIAPVTGG